MSGRLQVEVGVHVEEGSELFERCVQSMEQQLPDWCETFDVESWLRRDGRGEAVSRVIELTPVRTVPR